MDALRALAVLFVLVLHANYYVSHGAQAARSWVLAVGQSVCVPIFVGSLDGRNSNKGFTLDLTPPVFRPSGPFPAPTRALSTRER